MNEYDDENSWEEARRERARIRNKLADVYQDD